MRFCKISQPINSVFLAITYFQKKQSGYVFSSKKVNTLVLPMQRNILPLHPRISQVKSKLSKIATFSSLVIGIAYAQILLSPLASLAQSTSSASDHPVGDFLAWIFLNCLKWLIIVFVFTAILAWTLMWIQDTFYKLFGIKSQYEIEEADRKEWQERYDALSPEDQRELDRSRREFKRELDHGLQEINREKQRKEQHKEHQQLIVKMEQDRIMRENKIRDFRNRHGREPSSWEI
jgi:hypothetical protein